MSDIIRVNMTSRQVYKEQLPQYDPYGGRQLCARILLDEVKPNCEPLGAMNKLVFAPGLLAGSIASSASRISIGGKSPLTNGIKEANSGGTAGFVLARSSIKAIILEGKNSDGFTWVLFVKDGQAELVRDDTLKLKGTYQTAEILAKRYGSKNSILCIGPAGERGMSSACIAITDPTGELKYAARGGLGAVMGSKGLKAIVIEDSGQDGLAYHAKEQFMELARTFNKQLIDDPKTKSIYQRFGTSGIVKAVNAMGAFPVNNFRYGSTPHADKLSGEKLNELITARGGEGKLGISCMRGCVIKCSHSFPDEHGKKIISTLQYENIALIGSNLGFEDLDPVARLNWQINDIGMDAIEAGATLGVALDEGLGQFGSEADCMALLKEIRDNTVLGKVLGHGAWITGTVLGSNRIPTAKGQAFPGYDPRALKGNGVTYAMSPMGADHTAGNCFGARNEVNPLGTEGQGVLSNGLQVKMTTLDSLGFCIFARVPLFADTALLAGLVNALTGSSYDGASIWDIGTATLQWERAFNIAAGLSPAGDKLPEYVYQEPLPPTDAVFDLTAEEMAKAII
jgi:aldehyde:ferredoxin oxidoreductase